MKFWKGTKMQIRAWRSYKKQVSRVKDKSMYQPLSREEFAHEMDRLNKRKSTLSASEAKNPTRTIFRETRYINYKFQQKYEKKYREKVGKENFKPLTAIDVSTPAGREAMFDNWASQYRNKDGSIDYETARKEWDEAFYKKDEKTGKYTANY